MGGACLGRIMIPQRRRGRPFLNSRHGEAVCRHKSLATLAERANNDMHALAGVLSRFVFLPEACSSFIHLGIFYGRLRRK